MKRQHEPTSALTGTCGCGRCSTEELPLNPTEALRATYGMLLGEDDFRTLIGFSRGKQMLHNAWLHGRGVVWGYPVLAYGTDALQVGPGLALDGWGREVLHQHTDHLDLHVLLDELDQDPTRQAGVTDVSVDRNGCRTATVHARVVAQYDNCPASPVPTLADPCDVTREHDTWSRINERARIVLVPGPCPAPASGWHRVRVLLGLDEVDGAEDTAGHEALRARRTASKNPDPTKALMHAFRRMACLDVADLGPACPPGQEYPDLFPTDEEYAAVPLAEVTVTVRDDGTGWEFEDRPYVDCCVRTVLMPTATIAELTCGDAPGLISWDENLDAGGPRVKGDEIRFEHEGLRLVIPLDRPPAPGSVRDSVGITSLANGPKEGWVVEDVYDTHWDEDAEAIVVILADPPVNSLVRILVRGTGGKPVLGQDPPVPLAGLVGGPPGTRHQGHDAVWILKFPQPDDHYAADDQPEYPEQTTTSEQTEAEA